LTEQRPVTINDVAKLAGVAVSSVSRALGNHPDVSDAMREKVTKAAQELGYVPDPAAQSLRSGSTRLVGLVVRDFANPFFGEIINGIEDVFAAAGYTLLVTDSGRHSDQERQRISALQQRRVDALILSTVDDTSAMMKEAIESFKRPVLLLDRDFDGSSASKVLLDHASGVSAATSDLLQLGHRKIAMITGAKEIRPTRERINGFLSAYRDAGIDPSDAEHITGVFSPSFARAATADLLSREPKDRPTALIAGGVQATIGILESLSELGIRPGEDISLVVCDDLPWLRVLRPRISAVSRDPEAMGRIAAEMVLAMIRGDTIVSTTLPTRYEARDTTRPTSGVLAPS
jgi:LacI family transcriptional regulator